MYAGLRSPCPRPSPSDKVPNCMRLLARSMTHTVPALSRPARQNIDHLHRHAIPAIFLLSAYYPAPLFTESHPALALKDEASPGTALLGQLDDTYRTPPFP